MDLSWCLSCDRHCTEDNLYCSESCRSKDNESYYFSPYTSSSPSSSPSTPLFNSFSMPGTPTSPLEPFFSSFSHPHEHRNSVIMSKSSSPTVSLFAPIHGS
ncbi:hypothetical protein BC941DRAFT_437530 [Chlamydoabsidia padenii]|nr:hypothetical protein BC941DRAFT_437530 [Chlamydoabsidia padenii]